MDTLRNDKIWKKICLKQIFYSIKKSTDILLLKGC